MNDIQRTDLGRTGLGVTRLGYGSMELRHVGMSSRPELDGKAAGALLNEVLDEGINYIDTSPTYGPAEELIGHYIAHRRDEFFLATKAGFVIDELPARRQVFSKDVVRKGLEWSLRRLRTDYVDVVQLPGSPTPSELIELGTLDELEAMRSEGKCRFLGISGWLPSLAEHVDWGAFDTFQIPYSILERENASVIDRAAAAGIGTVIRGGVAQGSLSDAHAAEAEARNQRWLREGLDDLLDGGTRTEFLIRFVLSNRAISTAIIGTSSSAHLRANVLAALRGPLPTDAYAKAAASIVGS